MQTPSLPSRFLTTLNRNFPEAWRYADKTRAMAGAGLPEWDRAVFLPMAGWYAITCKLYQTRQLSIAQVELVSKLAAAGAWRPAQDIVRFEPELAASLISTELAGDIPADILWRLPAWCVYVDQPLDVCGERYQGFFAYLEQDANDGHKELRLHFLGENADFGFPVHIGEWSLLDGLEKMATRMRAGADIAGIASHEADLLARGDIFLASAQSALNLLLYICAYGFGDTRKTQTVSYPSPKRTKKGWRLFPPDRPVIHMPGKKFAEALRQVKAGERIGTHASPRPHIRRAHWHGFWSGSKDARRFDLRWLPPIAVAMAEDKK